jgi:hypothetical protein
MSDRRRFVPFWVPLLFGLMSLSNVISNPRVATLHGSDIVQLIGTGMCFGAALAVGIVLFRGPRPS